MGRRDQNRFPVSSTKVGQYDMNRINGQNIPEGLYVLLTYGTRGRLSLAEKIPYQIEVCLSIRKTFFFRVSKGKPLHDQLGGAVTHCCKKIFTSSQEGGHRSRRW